MGQNIATTNRPVVDAFLKKLTGKARIAFIIDATASRQPAWDQASQLQVGMFETAAAVGGLELQLIYFRGFYECAASPWFKNGRALAERMAQITCQHGHTKIVRALRLAQQEHNKEKINAVVLIGDACEEIPADIYAETFAVPIFAFQEGDDPEATDVFTTLAKLTGGVHCQFNSNSANQLADLLKGVAAFATGGLAALEKQGTSAATLLLTQLKKK
jgi:hypothetical protein